jgi:hypothetical protein
MQLVVPFLKAEKKANIEISDVMWGQCCRFDLYQNPRRIECDI